MWRKEGQGGTRVTAFSIGVTSSGCIDRMQARTCVYKSEGKELKVNVVTEEKSWLL